MPDGLNVKEGDSFVHSHVDRETALIQFLVPCESLPRGSGSGSSPMSASGDD